MGQGQSNTRQPGGRHAVSWHRRLVLTATVCVAGIDVASAGAATTTFRTGIDLTRQQLPQSADYLYVEDAAAAVARARAQVITWTDLDLRRDALRVIKWLQDSVDGGQRRGFAYEHNSAGRNRQ